MTTVVKSELTERIGTVEDLVRYLVEGARPFERHGIGIETEKLTVDAVTGGAAEYDRVEALLRRVGRGSAWEEIREKGRTIALAGPQSTITLEPGGQLELSGQLCPDLHCCERDFRAHIARIVPAGAELGLRFLGLGVQPLTPPARIQWVPKARYRIMAPHLARTGTTGLRMMKQTAGIQVNCDYADEQDCVDKLRVLFLLAPVQYALFANSPILDGCPSGFLSTRGMVWSRTAPERTGLIHALFEEGAGFRTYVEWALDVPMYFLFRDGRFVDLTREGLPFRRYLMEGWRDHRATLADWDLHLSTLFPEARLRPQLETRSADSLPPRLTTAVGALVKGVLYDGDARRELFALFRDQSRQEHDRLYRDSWRLALGARVGRRPLREVTREVLDIAHRGLVGWRKRTGGPDETVFLEGAREIAESGVTLAERLLQRWHGGRQEKVAALFEHCGFFEGCGGWNPA